MNMKKISLLVVTGMMFLLVMTTVVKTVWKGSKQTKELAIVSLKKANTSKEMLANMVKTYNYVEIVDTPVEETQPEEVSVSEPVSAPVQEEPNSPQVVYTGKLTGYGGDCPGCSGYLACRTREGNRFNLRENYTYNDTTFGNVRILSAASNGFPCGTVVKVNNGIIPEFNAIVLDTGGSMNSAWSRGEVWMDLAFSTSSDPVLKSSNSSNTTFEILRQGW